MHYFSPEMFLKIFDFSLNTLQNHIPLKPPHYIHHVKYKKGGLTNDFCIDSKCRRYKRADMILQTQMVMDHFVF